MAKPGHASSSVQATASSILPDGHHSWHEDPYCSNSPCCKEMSQFGEKSPPGSLLYGIGVWASLEAHRELELVLE